MFFFLSKLLQFLVSPFTWVVILLLLHLFVKRQPQKKRLLYAALGVLFLFSNKAIFMLVLNLYQPSPVSFKPRQQYSCGILLGGMGSYDEDGKGKFNENADRFIQTLKLYKQGHIKKIAITGGSSDVLPGVSYSEAAFVSGELVSMGVPVSDILIEGRARNTHENALFTKQLLDSLQLRPPYVLITSAIHIPRSIKVFDRAGMAGQIVPYPAGYLVADRGFLNTYIIPQVVVLEHWRRLMKEWVGIVAYSLTGRA